MRLLCNFNHTKYVLDASYADTQFMWSCDKLNLKSTLWVNDIQVMCYGNMKTCQSLTHTQKLSVVMNQFVKSSIVPITLFLVAKQLYEPPMSFYVTKVHMVTMQIIVAVKKILV